MIVNTETSINIIGFDNFKHLELLEIALNHPDYITEQHNIVASEKQLRILEHIGLVHLGSTVLSAVITNYLYSHFPNLQPETLTVIKSDLINHQMRSQFALDMGLDNVAQLGEQFMWKLEISRNSILADIFDAVVGAVYLECDRNITITQTWLVENFLAPALNTMLLEILAE